jgi:pSer/pThr/pTyr-binding forkhead associated (FHA) protein
VRAGIGGPHAASVAELKAQLELERDGLPFLVYRDGEGEQRLHDLGDGTRVSIGRSPAADVSLDWDEKASRLHAELERRAEDWVLVDEGLSRNGSYVNGQRVTGRRRLREGDVLRLGSTELLFRDPGHTGAHVSTVMASVIRPTATLSDTQRRVLHALCRPFKEAPGFGVPASNQEIADELFLSVDAVKAHLRVLFEKYGIGPEVPQNAKRLRLVEAAFNTGTVTERDL